ncbi:MAG: Glu/Leu/Phe/Val dehydrogenase dimerization domain-containing protein [Candidatus Pacearchaeota archaeon]
MKRSTSLFLVESRQKMDVEERTNFNGLEVEKLNIDSHEQAYRFTSDETGLDAIIAIHNSNLGYPCLGGCRMYPYSSREDMEDDVLNLSEEMTYKNSLANLDFGGSKCVIKGDPKGENKRDLLLSMADAINFMQGRIYTGQDSGIGEEDVNTMNESTSYLVGLRSKSGNPGEPTALGVYSGMKAAAKEFYGDDSLKDKTIAVSGLGGVGKNLLEHLVQEDCNLFITDVNQDEVERLSLKYNAGPVYGPEKILSLGCHIFSPNFTGSTIKGGALDALSLEKLSGTRLDKDLIIAGSTNRPFDYENYDELLNKVNYTKGMHLIPPEVINAGGVISVSSDITHEPYEKVRGRIWQISDSVSQIIKRSMSEGESMNEIAYKMAEERIYQKA